MHSVAENMWYILEKKAGPSMGEKGDFIINDLIQIWLKIFRKFGILYQLVQLNTVSEKRHNWNKVLSESNIFEQTILKTPYLLIFLISSLKVSLLKRPRNDTLKRKVLLIYYFSFLIIFLTQLVCRNQSALSHVSLIMLCL